MCEIRRGCEAAFTELIDVEGELGLDVGVGTLGIVDDGAVFLFEPGEFDGNGLVDGLAVSYVVADVMREGADGEGEVVGVLGVAEEAQYKVAGADVVSEVGEEGVAEGVVAEVLDGAAAVGIGVCLLKLGFGKVREAIEEDGTDGVLPGQVDDHFVGLDRERDAGRGRQDKDEQREGFE